MALDARLTDWLAEIRELNRLFLSYLHVQARDGQACLGLSGRVVRRLCGTDSAALDRVAELPTALFHLRIDQVPADRVLNLPACPTEQMRLALALTILGSARQMARSRPFEARMFLHLSATEVQRLRSLPLSCLPALACTPDILTCAMTAGGLRWPALIRDDEPDVARMLLLIALQPEIAPPAPRFAGSGQARRHSAG